LGKRCSVFGETAQHTSADDRDILDYAATRALLSGGSVHMDVRGYRLSQALSGPSFAN
jgi:hypothetical protein